MGVIYNVIIDTTDKEGVFHITWQQKGTNRKNGFKQKAGNITQEEVERLWQHPGYQPDVGKKLFRFLDGDNCYLQQALDQANRKGEPLQLNLCACDRTADWPFELLMGEGGFLLPKRVHLVRCVSEYGAEKEITPQPRPLAILFMACSALDVEPELDFEKEEEAIFEVLEKLSVDMDVEDSGSLEGVREQLVQQAYDVVHLSGHAGIDKKGIPYFIMEDETGNRRDVSPYELWEESLIENPPQLLFLSGCRTGQVSEAFAAFSFARRLVEKYNVPAVLGWGREVSDVQAAHAGKMIYHELSRGKGILEAVQRARHELIEKFSITSEPAWPLLRLFGSGMTMDAMVKELKKGQQNQLTPRQMVHTYLKDSQVKVLKEGFVGRRRQLQLSLRALKQDADKVGLLLLGTGGLGKSCLAGKISERFSKHTLIVVHGKFNAYTLEPELKAAFIQAKDEEGKQILAEEKEMFEKLAELCASGFKEKNYLILLDDFEQNIEGAEEGQPGNLLDEAKELLNVLLQYLPISGKMTQIMITSRYSFSLTNQDRDLIKERLEWITLTGFPESEQRKKARELENIFYYADQSLVPQLLAAGYGNPRLMEWLDVLVGEMEAAEVPQLLEAISGKEEEFIREHVIRELLQRGGDKLARLLHWFSIYRRPVLKEGVQQIGEKAGLETWEELLQQGTGLGLVEYDQARENYRVTPLLREELSARHKAPQTCHQAAFAYYEKICKDMETIKPVLVEEWIYHALGCGEEEVASEQGGILVNYLRDRLAFRESRRVGLWVLEEKKKLSTANDAFLLNEIAFTLYNLGDHRQAIKYYEQALTIGRKVYGEEHPKVALRLNNLGSAWAALGDHRKAIEYFEQALSIWKNVYGENHPDVATALNNLGEALSVLGEPKKAVVYYEQALTIFKKVYGDNHPNVASSLNNLGSAWADLGDHRKAIDYYEQALKIDRNVYGEEHPDVARDLNNLGETWRELGKPKKAIDYYEQALIIDQNVYGQKHPNVGIRLNNLGLAFDALGDHRKAIEYFEQALSIDRNVYDEAHPDVATDLNNLGLAWKALGDHRKAIEYYEQALTILKKAYGEIHPNIASSLNNLGLAWKALGDHRKAIEYYDQALTIDRNVYGQEHPKGAIRLNNLGATYLELGQKEKAKAYLEEAYAIFEKFFGPEHPETKNTAKWLEKCK